MFRKRGCNLADPFLGSAALSGDILTCPGFRYPLVSEDQAVMVRFS